MSEASIPRKKEPISELIAEERYGLQAELIQRFVERGGGTELEWSNRYAEKIGYLVDHDEATRALIRRDWQMALDVIEEALNSD